VSRRPIGAAALAWPLLLGACGGADGAADGDPASRTLTVFAAASLTEVFTDLGEVFEQEHDGVTVRFSFAGSSDLATQLEEGAPADVFASADAAPVDRVLAAGLVDDAPTDFAGNTLQIAVPPGDPAGVASLADLEGDVDLVVCAPQVPCGAAAVRLAEVAGVQLSPVSEEPSVTGVLDKVRTGEADAGLVYVTDVRATDGDVVGIDVPEAEAIVNVYPIAVTTDGELQGLAQAFVDLVAGEEGQAVLAAAGFRPP
jgi:molybdate transport system substrate-binding protein